MYKNFVQFVHKFMQINMTLFVDFLLNVFSLS